MRMSEFIFSWIKDIVLLFIIITLVDLVMPKGNMRRYINFVIGLLIIFTVVNPFMNLANLDFQLDREVFKNIDNQPKYDEEGLDGQTEQIESLYKEKIAGDIKAYLESHSEYRISSLDVEINKGEDNFGTISYLGILINDKNEFVKENDIDIHIEPVTLEYNTNLEKNNEFMAIKELISERYEIDKDLIDVSTIKLED